MSKKPGSKPRLAHLWRPTPKKWRKFGNACAASGLSLVGIAFITEHPKFAVVALFLTGVGTFFANLFAEDKDEADDKPAKNDL